MKKIAAAAFIVFSFFFVGDLAMATDPRFELREAGGELGQNLGEEPVPFQYYIVAFINVALTAIGTILIFLIIYAGVRWWTAGTDDDVKHAKDTLRNAVIGLIIILTSYAVLQFITNAFWGNPTSPLNYDQTRLDGAAEEASGSIYDFWADKAGRAYNNFFGNPDDNL